MDIEGLCMIIGFSAVLVVLPVMAFVADVRRRRG